MNDHKYTDSEVLVVAGGTSGKQQVNGTYADLRGASGEWYNTKLGEVRKAVGSRWEGERAPQRGRYPEESYS